MQFIPPYPCKIKPRKVNDNHIQPHLIYLTRIVITLRLNYLYLNVHIFLQQRACTSLIRQQLPRMMTFCDWKVDIVAKLRMDSAVRLGLTRERPVSYNWWNSRVSPELGAIPPELGNYIDQQCVGGNCRWCPSDMYGNVCQCQTKQGTMEVASGSNQWKLKLELED